MYTEERKEYNKKYYQANKEKIREKRKRFYQENPKIVNGWTAKYRKNNKDKCNLLSRNWHRKNRELVLMHYGKRCVCCGETRQEFLTVDHINKDGAAERKTIGQNGWKLYHYIIKTNFPDRYRILCYNCNIALGHYGYCPHGRSI